MFSKIYFFLLRFASKRILNAYFRLFKINKWYNKDDNGYTPGYKSAVRLRSKEYDGPKKIVITGDSVIFGGEDLWEGVSPQIRCTAIPGDDSVNFEKRLLDTILIYEPEVVYFDIGGNDFIDAFMKNKLPSADTIFNNIMTCIHLMKKAGVKNIIWMEIVPLGPALALLNKQTQDFNLRMRNFSMTSNLFDILPTRDVLAGPDGFIKPEFKSIDNIHPIRDAYTTSWVPQFKSSVQQFLV